MCCHIVKLFSNIPAKQSNNVNMPIEHKYLNKTINILCAVLVDGWIGFSSNCVGDHTEAGTTVPGAAKGSAPATVH